MSLPLERARVEVTHGRHLQLRTQQGEELTARPAQRGLRAVCGDWVQVARDRQHAQLYVVRIEPRSSALFRSNSRGVAEPLAANLSLLLVVLAPLPRPELFVVDRYLCAARSAGIDALMLLNKCELADAPLRQELSAYEAAGYRCTEVSASQGYGIEPLRAALSGQSAMLVGQSGMGKSSLLRALIPDADATIGKLASDRTGRHTTTATRLYRLAGQCELLDSPGVRDFAPAVDQLRADTLGFIELERLAAACRFKDCVHLQEPGCAVRAAVGTLMTERRYESYRRLRRLYQKLSRIRSGC